MKPKLTDEDVEREIAELQDSEEVKLARAEIRIKYRRRQYLYQLRGYARRGRELLAQGYTIEALAQMDREGDLYE